MLWIFFPCYTLVSIFTYVSDRLAGGMAIKPKGWSLNARKTRNREIIVVIAT